MIKLFSKCQHFQTKFRRILSKRSRPDKNQIIKLMQSPHNINLRSHHSLKSSAINEQVPYQHMNPLSSRLGSSKKISMNIKGDMSCNTPTSKNHQAHDAHNQLKIPWQANGAHVRNQFFITLGNKTKEAQIHYNTHNNSTDLHSKIEHIFAQLDKHNKRLGILEYKTNQNLAFKQQISKLNMHRSSLYPSPNDVKSQIQNIKLELAKLASTKQIERKVELADVQSKEALLSLQKAVNEDLRLLDLKVDQCIKKQMKKLTEFVEQKLQVFQQSISQYIDKLKLKDEPDEPKMYYEAGKFAQKLVPLLKNPNLRLKFLSRVSLVQKSRKNPENEGEGEYEQWEVETYSQTYMLDEEGYLLDDNQRYIVDSQGRCIKLSANQIKCLMGMKILS